MSFGENFLQFSIPTPPSTSRIEILWHQVKSLNHTRTIIHFILEWLLVTIDFFRMKCEIITTRSSDFAVKVHLIFMRFKNNYQHFMKIIKQKFDMNAGINFYGARTIVCSYFNCSEHSAGCNKYPCVFYALTRCTVKQ